jgi:DNA-binding transcriptional ArsR family regulator
MQLNCVSHPSSLRLAIILQKLYTFCMSTDQTARWLERVLTALSDPQRARILSILAEKEVPVTALVEVLHIVQPIVSRQLARLRDAQLVETKRDGKWMLYSLKEPPNVPATSVLVEALRQIKQTKQTQSDLVKLAQYARTISQTSNESR